MYGRARRLRLLKIIVISILSVLVVYAIIRVILNIIPKQDDNIDFAYLRKYMVSRGFSCEVLKSSGSACKYIDGDITERFSRFDDGFEYMYNNKKYLINIYHVGGVERILFNTGDGAFIGYKNLDYECTYKENILNELDKCVLKKDPNVELDNTTYIAVIDKTIKEVNKIIESSGYKKDILLSEYRWEKK